MFNNVNKLLMRCHSLLVTDHFICVEYRFLRNLFKYLKNSVISQKYHYKGEFNIKLSLDFFFQLI